MKVMISQPMAGKSEKEILEVRTAATEYLELIGYDVVDTYFNDSWRNSKMMKLVGVLNIPVRFLSKSIESMSMCDAVYFCKGWSGSRGCIIEHEVAERYGLKILEEV